MYEPLIRVPLIVKLPGGARSGERSDVLASTVDVAPMILRACGLEPGADMVGLDLTDAAAQRDCAFAEIRRGAAYMARTRTHKLLLGRNEAQTQVLDLEADPYELKNVATERPELRAEMESRLGRWLLFESPTPVRLDERAPQITGENVPSGAEHREALLAYFRRQMEVARV